MFELNASSFLAAATELARLRQVMNQVEAAAPRHEILVEFSVQTVRPRLLVLHNEATKIGAKSTCVALERFDAQLASVPQTTTVGMLTDALRDIESRFADHLLFVRLFVIPQEKANLFEGADKLLKQATATAFPSIWFDCEEAAKCLCLGRYTASVFHAMRMLEVAVASMGKRLAIPDPVKASERNWGIMLRSIQTALDDQFPRSKRLPGTEGAQLEAVFASLDAIKNPWRNATMHVESVYTEEEAGHILVSTAKLLDRIAALFGEEGNPLTPEVVDRPA